MGAFADLLEEIANRPKGVVVTIHVRPNTPPTSVEDIRDMVKWCAEDLIAPTFGYHES